MSKIRKPKPKAKCSWCHKMICVAASGLLGRHKDKDGGTCQGSAEVVA